MFDAFSILKDTDIQVEKYIVWYSMCDLANVEQEKNERAVPKTCNFNLLKSDYFSGIY